MSQVLHRKRKERMKEGDSRSRKKKEKTLADKAAEGRVEPGIRVTLTLRGSKIA